MRCGDSGGLGKFVQDVIEESKSHVDVIDCQDHRWFDLDHIVQGSIGAHEDAAGAHRVDDVFGFAGCGFEGGPVSNQFDADEQSGASDIPDDSMPVLKCSQSLEEVLAK